MVGMLTEHKKFSVESANESYSLRNYALGSSETMRWRNYACDHLLVDILSDFQRSVVDLTDAFLRPQRTTDGADIKRGELPTP